ncbi:MAG: hypothetical protein ACOQNV_02790 [Mycoplasmoidaceae bacterium]
MKNKLSMKNKTLIGALSALATSSAIFPVVSLSSCSKDNEVSKVRIGDDLDKEYNINESSYIALKEKFKKEWENKVTAHDDWTDEQKAREIQNLNTDLAAFDKSFNNQSFVLSNTWKSQAIINFALQHYGINISRDNLSVTWSDIRNIFDGYIESFKTYMHDFKGMSEQEIALIIAQAENAYKNLIEGTVTDDDGNEWSVGLKAKYNDPLAALVQAKSEMIACFAHVNDSIALLSGVANLKKFLQTYNVVYRQTNSNAFDQLVDSGIISQDKIGTDLSANMTKIFRITDTLHPDREIKTFDGTKFIPGYTIKPVLESVETNRYTNTYIINIDWQCYKSEFADDPKMTPERLAGITGHLYDDARVPDKDNPIPDDFDVIEYMNAATIHVTPYNIPLTAQAEKEALQSAYFNGQPFKYDSTTVSKGMINLGWFSELEEGKTHQGYDAFYQGRKIDDQNDTGFTHYRVNFASLIDADIEFKYAEANSNALSGPLKVSDYLSALNTGVVDTTVEHDKKNTPLILDTLINNCVVYSDALVKNDDWDNREAYNTLNVFYRNSQYAHDVESASIHTLGQFDTSGFANSKSSYKWLTNQYNRLLNTVERLSNNDYAERWKAAKEMCIEQSIMFTLTSALALLCSVAGIISIVKVGKQAKAIVFWVDLILTLAIESIDIWRYYNFMHNYYFPTKNMNDAAEKLRNSAETKTLKKYLNEQKEYFGIVRANDKLEILKADFDANYDKYFKKLDPRQLKERMDEFANIKQSKVMIDFLDKVAEEGPTVKTYEEYMKEWDNEGHYNAVQATSVVISTVLCTAQLWWMFVCGIIGGNDPETQAVTDTTAEVASKEAKVGEDLSKGTANNSPVAEGDQPVGDLLNENQDAVRGGEEADPIIHPDEGGNAGGLPDNPGPQLSESTSSVRSESNAFVEQNGNTINIKKYWDKLNPKGDAPHWKVYDHVREDLLPKLYKDKDFFENSTMSIARKRGGPKIREPYKPAYNNILKKVKEKFPDSKTEFIPAAYESVEEFYAALKKLTNDSKINESLFEEVLKGIDEFVDSRALAFKDEFPLTVPSETLFAMYKAGKDKEVGEFFKQLIDTQLLKPKVGLGYGAVDQFKAGDFFYNLMGYIYRSISHAIIDDVIEPIKIIDSFL